MHRRTRALFFSQSGVNHLILAILTGGGIALKESGGPRMLSLDR